MGQGENSIHDYLHFDWSGCAAPRQAQFHRTPMLPRQTVDVLVRRRMAHAVHYFFFPVRAVAQGSRCQYSGLWPCTEPPSLSASAFFFPVRAWAQGFVVVLRAFSPVPTPLFVCLGGFFSSSFFVFLDLGGFLLCAENVGCSSYFWHFWKKGLC